jgi:hypothetical protein
MARKWFAGSAAPLAATMTVDQCWTISATWYRGRLALDYQPPPPEARQALLTSVGLNGAAWILVKA